MPTEKDTPSPWVMRERARELRRAQTPAESILWGRLRSQQLSGYKFRRQHPIEPFIVDFCCPACCLVIELDGDTHAFQEEYDRARTARLKAAGYHVLRFTNREVQQQLEGVLEAILGECHALLNRSSGVTGPHLDPLPARGERE
jgi:very-short-patch-repair endonuclease